MEDPTGILSVDSPTVAAALDAVDDVFYVFDTDQRLVAWNEAFATVTGYDSQALFGRHPDAFVREQDHEKLSDYLTTVDDRGSGTVRVEVETASGSTIPYEFYSDALADEDGELLGRVGIGRDISERAKYQRRLELENERLDEFASTLAHDLRNPLNVAQLELDLLAKACANADAEDHVASVEQAHERIDRIISDMLELARTGELVATRESVQVGELAQEIWPDIEHGSASLTVDDQVTVPADESLLERMLTNLLRNAVEHAGETVAVRIGPLDTGAGFYISDDGPGIDAAERETVFEWAHTTKEGGFGVGLQSVEKICDAHEWSVTVVESEAGGARFEIGTT